MNTNLKKTKRNEEMRILQKNGASLREIGELYGISRQRVHQVLSYQKYKATGNRSDVWKYVKNRTLKRDNYQCQICFTSLKLDVIKLDGKGHNYRENNLMTLCARCRNAINKGL